MLHWGSWVQNLPDACIINKFYIYCKFPNSVQGKISYKLINLPVMATQSSVVSDDPQSEQSSRQQYSQHPHLLIKHPQTIPRQLQQIQQALVTHQNPSFPSHQQPQLMKTNLAANKIAQNQLIGQQTSLQNKSQNSPRQHLQGQQNNQSNIHQQQLAQQSNFSELQQRQQLLAKQCGNSSMLQTEVAMEGQQMKQTALALLPTQGQQSKSKLPERQLISQSQLEQMKRLPNPSKQVAMGNFQTSGMLKHGLEIIFQKKRKDKENAAPYIISSI
jgi:hypothetical protein